MITKEEMISLCSKASPGPWAKSYDNGNTYMVAREHGLEGHPRFVLETPKHTFSVSDEQVRANADFCAAAREWIPKLLEENEYLANELVEMENL